MNAASLLVIDGDDVAPFAPAPRTYTGCMARIVPGVEFIDGAYPENPELVFSWLLHRYRAASQATILAFFKTAGDEDFLLSWPDFDGTPEQFYALILRVKRAGFRPLVMLSAKGGATEFHDVLAAMTAVLPIIKRAGVPRVCIGWELNAWLSPEVLQALIDWIAPFVRAYGGLLYVHFTPGYGAWQPNGKLFADFWWANINKLRGLLHQKVTNATDQEYQFGEGGLHDILLHFNGGSLCPADSGDGTPFDAIAFEVNLELFSLNQISESEYHRRARIGVRTPPTVGPTGIVCVMGSGSGQ